MDLDGDESRLLYTEYVHYEYALSEYTVQVEAGGIAGRFNIILPKGLIAEGNSYQLNIFIFILSIIYYLFC